MPYRKHEHRVRGRGDGGGGWRKLLMSSDIIGGPAEAARGYHRVYLYDEHRCTATVPLGAQGCNSTDILYFGRKTGPQTGAKFSTRGLQV